MDSKSNFLNKLKSYISSINEEYLIGVTNKGVFNRALKDLNSGAAVKLTIEEDFIKCELPDGNTCSINENIQDFKCSCPSRSICKHTIMSYIYVKQNLQDIFDTASKEEGSIDEESEIIQDFSELLNIDIKSIKSSLGDKEFGNIAKRMEFGLKVIIKEESLLQVEFEGEDTIVKFIPGQVPKDKSSIPVKDSLIVSNSICSCKSKELCKHKAEAIIQYDIYKDAIDKREVISLIKKDRNISKERLENCIKEVRKVIGEIYSAGLARIPESFVDKLERTCVICHNNDVPSLEKKIKALQGKLKLYSSRNAAFSVESFRQLLQNTYILTVAMENCKDDKSLQHLVGEHKTSYYDIPPIELTGIGASSWSTESGYEGTTVYFIAEGFNKWFTYTASMPVENKNKQDESCPWGINMDLSRLSTSKISLINGKVNGEYRLSSSESSKGEVLGSTNLSEKYIQDKSINAWKEVFLKLSDGYKFGFSESEENDNLFLLRVHSFGHSNFEVIHQSFTMDLYDVNGESMTIRIKYTKHNKKLIDSLENMERLNTFPYMLLAKVYAGEKKLIAMPITAYYENDKIVNLTM